jgi:hypothetical protein
MNHAQTKIRKRKKYGMIAIDLNMVEEEITVFVDGEKVAKTYFMFDGPMIRVTDVSTEDGYKLNGYGRMMFDVLKAVARHHKMPIILWSLDDAIPFYEKIGMLHLNDPKVQERVIFANIKDDEHRNREIDNDDFIWLPKGLRGRPLIYL